MCSTYSLVSQLFHALSLALTLAALGFLGLALDRYASKLIAFGATRETVFMVRHTAAVLLCLDAVMVLAVGAGRLVEALLCVPGL